MNFRQWQHVRWSGSQHKQTPGEAAIKKIDSPSEKPKPDSKGK